MYGVRSVIKTARNAKSTKYLSTYAGKYWWDDAVDLKEGVIFMYPFQGMFDNGMHFFSQGGAVLTTGLTYQALSGHQRLLRRAGLLRSFLAW